MHIHVEVVIVEECVYMQSPSRLRHLLLVLYERAYFKNFGSYGHTCNIY